jgi:arsenate reductase-like glutaredoxin family protein
VHAFFGWSARVGYADNRKRINQEKLVPMRPRWNKTIYISKDCSMTQLLEHAFQKAIQELDETEQDLLAKFLLQHNLHRFLNEEVHFLNKYNTETQQAIQEAAERKNLNHYHSADELFTKLAL